MAAGAMAISFYDFHGIIIVDFKTHHLEGFRAILPADYFSNPTGLCDWERQTKPRLSRTTVLLSWCHYTCLNWHIGTEILRDTRWTRFDPEDLAHRRLVSLSANCLSIESRVVTCHNFHCARRVLHDPALLSADALRLVARKGMIYEQLPALRSAKKKPCVWLRPRVAGFA